MTCASDKSATPQPDELTAPVKRTPVVCQTMVDVRREIDRVDREIVAILAERQNYIAQAGHIKGSRDAVRDEARIEDVVTKVRAEAICQGAHPDLAETMYRPMIDWCIAYEFTVFDAKRLVEPTK